ncbi:hypothetical protein BDN72DRAFT_846545 [Pluteus cervinus]|uniref:Uncharacterized protein n=1 Tax=Pluteus cervinus TaxID=181527 RepID=A0ACD3AFS1_9AGAR|nr:hypothetical protein BDN72DRAFT_846545 [Pluteus cervinus]
MSSSDPAFPLEIEEMIFSLCVQNDLKNGKNLILVAKRVYEWLKPQLYKVVILHDESDDDSHFGRPKCNIELLKTHGHHVRHILLWESDIISDDPRLYNPATCLSWCPNVVNIALWRVETTYNEHLIDRLLSLPLTHLSFDVTWLDEELRRHAISKRVCFTSITHLDLNGMEITLRVEKIKEYFPSLTHIALGEALELPAKAILDCWGDQLEVLIWYSYDDNGVSDDPRVVVISEPRQYVHDWNEAAMDGPSSVWRRAEMEVKRRRGVGM